MGQFSWIACDTKRPILDNKIKDSYLLIPKEFKDSYGGNIKETYYEGYGCFGGHDVYSLVAIFNRKYLCEDMLDRPESIDKFGGLYGFEEEYLKEMGFSDKEIEQKEFERKKIAFDNALARFNFSKSRLIDFKSGTLSDEELKAKYGSDYLRLIGIDIACYDENNATLPYPIKIAEGNVCYEDYCPSISDPDQGWGCSIDYDSELSEKEQRQEYLESVEEQYDFFCENYYLEYQKIGVARKDV